MGITINTTYTATCDVCQSECGDRDGNIVIRINGGDRDVGPSTIWGQIFVNHPYGCTKGIVCKRCQIIWLEHYIDEIKKQEAANGSNP